MRLGSRKPVLSKPVLTLLGTFPILTVAAASDALAAGTRGASETTPSA